LTVPLPRSRSAAPGQRRELLSVRGLRVTFHTQDGTVRAVNGVDIDLAAGSTLGIVGESGCGKSVTSLAIMRLIQQPPGRIESGEVRLDGRDLLALSEEEMRAVRGQDVAMIFQDPMTSLNPVLTVGEQIGEVLRAHFSVNASEARRRSVALMKLVGIPLPEQRATQYPHQLSGGMRQRAMIAMALACQPLLLIADEPTTALDVTIQAQILDLMRDLVAEKETALILITHDLGVVAGMCEKTSVMYAGFIVEQASTRELFARPRHPYTLGLLGSIPRLDQRSGGRLTPIHGLPPDLTGDLGHCPFAPRCPLVQERCWRENPALELTGDDDEHAVACWYPLGEQGWRTVGSAATSGLTSEQAASRHARGEQTARAAGEGVA
jgi:oligopeptide transport system ATP-binding protein